MRQIDCIRKSEPELDDSEYAKAVFADFPVPKKVKPAWHYNHLDYGLLSEVSGDFKCLMPGPN